MGEHALIAHETDPMVALLLLIIAFLLYKLTKGERVERATIIAIVVGYLGMHFLFSVIGG